MGVPAGNESGRNFIFSESTVSQILKVFEAYAQLLIMQEEGEVLTPNEQYYFEVTTDQAITEEELEQALDRVFSEFGTLHVKKTGRLAYDPPGKKRKNLVVMRLKEAELLQGGILNSSLVDAVLNTYKNNYESRTEQNEFIERVAATGEILLQAMVSGHTLEDQLRDVYPSLKKALELVIDSSRVISQVDIRTLPDHIYRFRLKRLILARGFSARQGELASNRLFNLYMNDKAAVLDTRILKLVNAAIDDGDFIIKTWGEKINRGDGIGGKIFYILKESLSVLNDVDNNSSPVAPQLSDE
jgi:hypothetical protein